MNEVMEKILHHNRRDISHGLKGDKDIITLEQKLKQKEYEDQQQLVRKEKEKEN